MRMLVLGAGLQGCAAAAHLLNHARVRQVTLADHRFGPLPAFLSGAGDRLARATMDAADAVAVGTLMKAHDAALCALPYYFNEPMTRAAIAAGIHFSDLGGNTEIVFAQKALHTEAAAAGVSVIPDCGLAPGMVNILAAEGIRRLDRTDAVRIYVGGLPQHPEPPLNYQIVYSLEGALDYYTTPSWILRDGTRRQVDALSEVEPQDFPAPAGRLEAFHTGGGISTLPFTWEGKIGTMEYKTLRYPGHAELMRAIRDLGLIAKEPVTVKDRLVTPRDVFIAAVQPKLRKPEGRDLVALRVTAEGSRDGRAAREGFQLLDLYDETRGVSAMMRTTGYSLALTALMQVDGTITTPGVHTADEVVPFRAYVDGLAAAGIRILDAAVVTSDG